MDKAKPFSIPKREVWEAFKRVKANQGAAGVDGQSILRQARSRIALYIFERGQSVKQPVELLRDRPIHPVVLKALQKGWLQLRRVDACKQRALRVGIGDDRLGLYLRSIGENNPASCAVSYLNARDFTQVRISAPASIAAAAIAAVSVPAPPAM